MTGILGSANLLNGPNQAIYVNDKSAATVATVSVVNRNPSRSARVRIAVSASQTPADTDWVEYDTEIPPLGVLERTGLWVNSLGFIVVRSNMPNVNAVAWGITKGNTVSAPALVVPTIGTITWSTASGLGSTTVGANFRRDLLAIDSNNGTVFYNLTSGSTLPPGIGLSTFGVLEGSATTAGSYNFTITASNGTNTANRAFSLSVS